VDLCWCIVSSFEQHFGLPAQRLRTRELEIAEEQVVEEARGRLELATGCAHRQPELCDWLASSLRQIDIPLSSDSFDDLVLATFACVLAADRAYEEAVRGQATLLS
jgi:hypothetical protein